MFGNRVSNGTDETRAVHPLPAAPTSSDWRPEAAPTQGYLRRLDRMNVGAGGVTVGEKEGRLSITPGLNGSLLLEGPITIVSASGGEQRQVYVLRYAAADHLKTNPPEIPFPIYRPRRRRLAILNKCPSSVCSCASRLPVLPRDRSPFGRRCWRSCAAPYENSRFC